MASASTHGPSTAMQVLTMAWAVDSALQPKPFRGVHLRTRVQRLLNVRAWTAPIEFVDQVKIQRCAIWELRCS